jgi:hypothetical protein
VDINFEHYFDPVSMSQKLDVIEDHLRKNRNSSFDAEDATAMAAYKKLKKIKHPSRNELLFIKSLERDIDKVIKIIKDSVLESLSKTGLPQLKPLIAKNLLGAMPVCSENGRIGR